ncbi:UNVERIFIED_CONTAM: hypothetical protein Sindi_0724400 [Sesamum indicum]
METSGFSTTGEYSNVVGDGGDVPIRKDPNMQSLKGCSEVGFGSGALKRAVNGGDDSSSPPVYFNIEEFLLLANRILDGDDKSKAALNDLKARWEKKFGRFAANKLVTAPVPILKPVRRVWPAKMDCLAEKITGERVTVQFLPGIAEENAKITAAMSSPDSSSVSSDRTATEVMGKRSGLLDDGSPAISPANRRGASDAEVAANLDDVAPCVEEVEADVAYEVNADFTDDITARAYVTADVTDDARADVTDDVTVARADVRNDVTAARADVTDDVTAARADVTDDVTAARAIVTDDVTARAYVTTDVIDDVTARAYVTEDVTARAYVIDDVTAGVNADATAKADVTTDVLQKNIKFQNLSTNHTGLFVGNIPLNTCPDATVDDKIAQAFNNCTRKTLTFIAPTMQNGEVIVRPTLDIIRNGSKRWRTTAVGYFLGKRPYFHHVKEFAMSVWSDLVEVPATNNGFFFFQFKTIIAMEDIIEGGPWLFQGQPIVLQKWEPGLVLRILKHTQVPVWIKLRHLPMELWTEEGLSTVASGVGKPLYPDAITRACTRLDFARVCVMLDITSQLPKHIIIMTPDEEGRETPCKVDVEYEWVPPKCTGCMSLGHSITDCSLNKIAKPIKPPVSVYVPKSGGSRVPRMQENMMKRRGMHLQFLFGVPLYRRWKMLEDADDATRGPKTSSPKLHFIGLLETRVRINNASHIQSFLLPHWKWFMNYALTGNRIWIGWDDNFLDVTVVDLSTQFLHCHVTIRALQESVDITVIYGATELADRRSLWDSLSTIAIQCVDTPSLVGGDFNAVRDHSEVCGASGDIRPATEEFNYCI